MKLLTSSLTLLQFSTYIISGTLAQQATIGNPKLSINNIPFSTRAYWMRQANAALSQLVSPCPFGAFGTVIVNHTAPGEDGLGELVCMGANNISLTGNPTLHGKSSQYFLNA
jgi:hypothetical protein